MKKTLLLLGIGLFFLFPFLVQAKEDVSIVDASVLEKSEHAVELEKITYDQLSLSFKLSFQEVNDYIRYKVIVQNNSNKDYEIKKETDGFQNSEFFLYQFDFEGDSSVVKAHTSKTLYLTARYMKEIDSSLYEDGKFVEKNQMKINLANDNIPTNPYTGIPYIVILVGAVAAFIGFVISINNRRFLKCLYGAFILSVISIPFIGYALELLELEVNSEIEVVGTHEFCYYNPDNTPRYQYFEYTPGMTMSEYLMNHDLDVNLFHYSEGQLDIKLLNSILSEVTNGEYTDISIAYDSEEFAEYVDTLSLAAQDRINNIMGLYEYGKTGDFMYNPILDKSIGCYELEIK